MQGTATRTKKVSYTLIESQSAYIVDIQWKLIIRCHENSALIKKYLLVNMCIFGLVIHQNNENYSF